MYTYYNRVVICENKGVMGKVYPSMFYCFVVRMNTCNLTLAHSHAPLAIEGACIHDIKRRWVMC